MLWGGSCGGLEIRTSADGSTVLRGRFPYESPTILRGGRDARREVFEARAFSASVDGGQDIHLLAQHDFDKPLASRSAGSVDFIDAQDGLSFEARIAPEMREVSYVKDILAGVQAGLIMGVSPGFTVPRGGEEVRRDADGLTRSIKRADLAELSIVTRPAYPDAQVEARSWQATSRKTSLGTVLARWRP